MARDHNRPMSFTVEIDVTLIDPAQWTRAFGVQGREMIREDVRNYIANHLACGGVFANGEVEAEISRRR
jgi:hypothetical protein